MNELFSNINNNEKNKILNTITTFTYKYDKEEIITKDIFFKKSICLVLKGTINIYKLDYNGNQYYIEELVENNLFTTFSTIINNEDYQIKASNNTTILIINFENLINLNLNTKYYNQLLKNCLSIFSNNIYELNNRLDIISNKTIRNKLLNYFKLLSKKYNSNIIYLPFNFTNLANYLCVDRSAMNRELKNLKEEKLIEIKGKRIKLNLYIN